MTAAKLFGGPKEVGFKGGKSPPISRSQGNGMLLLLLLLFFFFGGGTKKNSPRMFLKRLFEDFYG